MEMNQIGGADIKVNQANYDGMRGIIICSSYFYAVPIDFIVALIIVFITLLSFLSNMDQFIQLYLCVFFAHAGEMASVYDVIDVEEEPFFHLLDFDQVCSVFFRILLFAIDYHKKHILINKSGTAASCGATVMMVFTKRVSN